MVQQSFTWVFYHCADWPMAIINNIPIYILKTDKSDLYYYGLNTLKHKGIYTISIGYG